ncbi:MAG: DUF2254 domain-containing protein [Fibrobacterota bacterium]|nr:DUF2254 domain-containing protein [Fibrobacterota bacterium]
MLAKLNIAWYWVRSSFWFIPTLMVLGAIGLAEVSLRLDNALLPDTLESLHWIYAGSAEGARQLLATIAGSMITVAGVVFSITIVALTLASSQFGPRILRNFMSDKGNQVVLGVFIATFLYCLLVIRTVRGKGEGNGLFVPHLSTTLGVALALVCLGFLIYYIHHVSSSLQVDDILGGIAGGLKREGEGRLPEEVGRPWNQARADGGLPDGKPMEIPAGESGYLQSIDFVGLYRFAIKCKAVVDILYRPGEFVIKDTPLLRLWSKDASLDAAERTLKPLFILGAHRTPTQDYSFKINLLVEIAVRALSPSINDPFTALMCIDRLGEALIPMAGRPPPRSTIADDENNLRIHFRPVPYTELLSQALDLIRHYGATNPMVAQRVLQVLKLALERAKSPETIAALSDHARRFARENGWSDPADRDRVLEAYGGFLEVRKEIQRSQESLVP